MVLGKIFRKDRKTEPISVFSLRIIISTLLIIVLVGYALFLILDVYNDRPSIISSFTSVNSFPVPTNNTREENKTCLQYIKQPVLDTNSSNYNGYFQTGGKLLFSTNFNDNLKNIGIMIYIDDSTYNVKNLSKTIDSYNIKITRNIKKLMTKSWKNYLGFTPDLETIPYFTSTIESNLITNSTGLQSLFSIITIEPYSFIIKVDTDQSVIIGLLGGAFGLIKSLYALLFGTKAIQPWGLAQRCVFKVDQTAQNHLMNILEPMQFLEDLTHNSGNSDNSDNLEDHLLTEKIAKRIDSLQLMLRDYVVN
ncbi:20797_t:CDS:2, partial [Gigaspora margarita]